VGFDYIKIYSKRRKDWCLKVIEIWSKDSERISRGIYGGPHNRAYGTAVYKNLENNSVVYHVCVRLMKYHTYVFRYFLKAFTDTQSVNFIFFSLWLLF
jgi:hypothetical protein